MDIARILASGVPLSWLPIDGLAGRKLPWMPAVPEEEGCDGSKRDREDGVGSEEELESSMAFPLRA